MREIRLSGSVEGVVSNHDPYSDSVRLPPGAVYAVPFALRLGALA